MTDFPTADEVRRFLSHVEVLKSGCWLWTGARSRGKGNKKWYGSFWFRGRTIRAHRFSVDYLKGTPCPPGFHRDHLCEFSLCVCPDCFEVVPNTVNQERKCAKEPYRPRSKDEHVQRLIETAMGGVPW